MLRVMMQRLCSTAVAAMKRSGWYRAFEKIEELEQVLSERCCGLLKQRDLIRGLTHFHGWQAANA
jgi:hypothetical protein